MFKIIVSLYSMIFLTGIILGDDNSKIATLIDKAKSGSADAQFELAENYEYGQGIAKDAKKAVFWYRKAAEQGFAEAQYNLGWKLVCAIGTDLE